MNAMYDVVIVGAGPSGLFCAYELLERMKGKKILLVEQGRRLEKRVCPMEKTGKCMNCNPCNNNAGFSGAGAFSDGKLTLYSDKEEKIQVGGNLQDYVGTEETKKLIDYVDQTYLDFGADERVEGIDNQRNIEYLRQNAKIWNIEVINVPIRHLGTEKAHILFQKMQDYLEASPLLEILFETKVEDLIIENGQIKGVVIGGQAILAKNVVVAVGRKGADWLSAMCTKHSIAKRAGAVDIGVRYELKNEIMSDINEWFYEGKFIAYPDPYKDKVRTFCQNPSGFVTQEGYDGGIKTVNGHSYKKLKSDNTNLAILVSHKFSPPFEDPIEYGRNFAKSLNQLGGGNIVVQRLGDINSGKRTWPKELAKGSVKPTLETAYAGDITNGIDYRTMTSILNFINGLNYLIPGFAKSDNLLYAPEIKFYSNEVCLTEKLETNVTGLYCIGDGGGLTRGLMQASCSGVKMARILTEKMAEF